MARAVPVRVRPWAPSITGRVRDLPKLGKDMLTEYLPILIFIGISTVIGIVLVSLGTLLGPRNPTSEKQSPFECGFEAFEDTRMKFDVRFYLVTILFIISS